MPLKYIITGVPGTGKSTLIKELEKKDFKVMHEVSRSVIIEEQKQGNNGTPWGDVSRFNTLVYEETIRQLPLHPYAIFTDRGLIDNIAYLKCASMDIPEELSSFPFKKTYHKMVFFAPPWQEIYVKDKQRPQSFEEHTSLCETLMEIYRSRDFELIFLPFTSVEQRVEFILDKIQE